METSKLSKELVIEALKFYIAYLENKIKLKKPNICPKCGYIASWIGEIHRHHIDGNHKNNKQINIQYLCEKCHMKLHKEKRNDDNSLNRQE